MYMKSLRWALAVTAVLLAVSTVTIVALASRAGMVSLLPLLRHQEEPSHGEAQHAEGACWAGIRTHALSSRGARPAP